MVFYVRSYGGIIARLRKVAENQTPNANVAVSIDGPHDTSGVASKLATVSVLRVAQKT